MTNFNPRGSFVLGEKANSYNGWNEVLPPVQEKLEIQEMEGNAEQVVGRAARPAKEEGFFFQAYPVEPMAEAGACCNQAEEKAVAMVGNMNEMLKLSFMASKMFFQREQFLEFCKLARAVSADQTEQIADVLYVEAEKYHRDLSKKKTTAAYDPFVDKNMSRYEGNAKESYGN